MCHRWFLGTLEMNIKEMNIFSHLIDKMLCKFRTDRLEQYMFYVLLPRSQALERPNDQYMNMEVKGSADKVWKLHNHSQWCHDGKNTTLHEMTFRERK